MTKKRRKRVVQKSARNYKSATRRKSRNFSQRLKKTVFSDFSKENMQKTLNSKRIQVLMSKKRGIIVNIATDPLDSYRSPYLLDLSQARFIERVCPDDDKNSSYEELPGGKLMSQLHIFKLLDFKKSEIFLVVKKIWHGLSCAVTRRPIHKINFSPKIPLVQKNVQYHNLSRYQEVVFINLLVFISSKIVKAIKICHSAVIFVWQNNYRQKDEIFQFKSKPVEDDYRDTLAPVSVVAENKKITKLRWGWIGLKPNIGFQFTLVPVKALAMLTVLALMAVIPIKFLSYWQDIQNTKGEILGETEDALANLNLAQAKLGSFDFSQAGNYFSIAGSHFVSAQNQLKDIRSFLTILAENSVVGITFKSGKNLLELGEHLASAGEHLLKGTDELISESSDLSLTSRIKNFKLESILAREKLKTAQNNLNKIKARHLPVIYQDEFITLKEKIPRFIASLKQVENTADFIIQFLGDNDLRRYLVVFQNDNEIRATGGFMGSFALLDLKSGNINNISIPSGGTYDVRAGLNELIEAPKAMQLANPRWEFQDSNWWPDWPKSAKNIAWFYEKANGPTVDGVIAVNSDWLGNLLSIVGPIDLPDYGKIINAANFEDEIQREVEIDYENKKEPKKILGDLAPQLLERIFNAPPENIFKMATAVTKGLNSKDIMVYLFDEKSQQFIKENNWDGRIKNSESDYLQVVASNIGGGKTDNAIKQQIFHQAKIADDGSIIDTVLIRRSHFGPIDSDFTIVANRSYLRIYVPQGSEFIKAVGFGRPDDLEFREVEDYLEENEKLSNENDAIIDENSQTRIYNEDNKTVFANWLTINPGESQDLLLKYKLPFKLDLNQKKPANFYQKFKASLVPADKQGAYSLLIQKQSGSDDDKIVSQVIYPDKLTLGLVYPNATEQNKGEVIFDGELNKDLLYFVNFSY